MKIQSRIVKEARLPSIKGPHITPIYASSSFDFENLEEGMAIFAQERSGLTYSRYGNPNTDAIAMKVASLEGHETEHHLRGLLTSSGMAAVHVLLQSLLQQGDAILTHGDLYGGSIELFKNLYTRFGIRTHYAPLQHPEEISNAIKLNPTIKLIYIETPSNPLLSILDIKSVTAMAKTYGLTTVLDNTFATPYLQQPFRFGVDYVIHSGTKYLNGHGSGLTGVIIGHDIDSFKNIWTTLKLTGSIASPFEAWLLGQGIKTLALRMDRHCSNALGIAQRLGQDGRVHTINYPGLPNHPMHHVAQMQMSGFGGMLSFEVAGGLEGAKRFMNALRFCSLTPTLGDTDTLVLHPATMSHRGLTAESRLALGITDGLIRLSVGLEDIEDIWEDLHGALDRT